MAIDVKSITQLISEFRKLQTKDSITPESLGYILQRLADLLATAGTSETVNSIQTLLNGFKAAGQAVVSLQQGAADRNNILANIKTVDLGNGSIGNATNHLFIQQATTERAGAMRAQQVTDLNNARRAVADIQKILETVQAKLGLTEGNKGLYNNAQIQVTVQAGKLRMLGAQQLIADGYVPYLFRLTRKRNQWGDKVALEAGVKQKKYCAIRKGWNLYGSVYSISIASDNTISFSTNPHSHQSQKALGYSSAPDTLVTSFTRKDGTPTFGWGRSSVKLVDRKSTAKKHRMIRLRFAIGFAKKIMPGRSLITTANLVSSLAEFSLIYNPSTKTWHFGK